MNETTGINGMSEDSIVGKLMRVFQLDSETAVAYYQKAVALQRGLSDQK
ncbi:MAG: hypothetical protein IJ833_05410 [Lachnospiraceae bacterium]|nr:hypothetical protein [Lachnospiraceae bacterium]